MGNKINLDLNYLSPKISSLYIFDEIVGKNNLTLKSLFDLLKIHYSVDENNELSFFILDEKDNNKEVASLLLTFNLDYLTISSIIKTIKDYINKDRADFLEEMNYISSINEFIPINKLINENNDNDNDNNDLSNKELNSYLFNQPNSDFRSFFDRIKELNINQEIAFYDHLKKINAINIIEEYVFKDEEFKDIEDNYLFKVINIGKEYLNITNLEIGNIYPYKKIKEEFYHLMSEYSPFIDGYNDEDGNDLNNEDAKIINYEINKIFNDLTLDLNQLILLLNDSYQIKLIRVKEDYSSLA